MAAQVSSLVQCLNNSNSNSNSNSNGYEEDNKSALITRDLLGIGSSITSNSNQELDLDLEVPKGWEKRLDLKSGKVYLQRCSSPPKRRATSAATTTSSSSGPSNSSPTSHQDLNFPPSSFLSKSNTLNLNLFDDAFLDLKLLPTTSSSVSFSAGNNNNNNNNYQSVCTLDKVRSALERAEKEPIVVVKKRSSIWKSSSSPTSSSSSSSTSLSSFREEDATATDNNKLSTQHCQSQLQSQVAAGCPSCLLYVLISKSDPKCPRCNAHVPLCAVKKPRIDLNISI